MSRNHRLFMHSWWMLSDPEVVWMRKTVFASIALSIIVTYYTNWWFFGKMHTYICIYIYNYYLC